ncbi:Dyp-type peroxidase [Acinetobacter seifertii]|uniref:Dyp-type peroxidase n=1 Tax=Acinetobacter seifertii TaxID=1530123 RepID=UPI00168A4963|nr:Dyp-type peroxidase [Acinetobacter seifertii]QNX86433.1 Dyp-type peroxidase [Acinetobacter seifertii]
MLNISYEDRFTEIWKYMQRGLVYPSPHAIFSTVWLNKEITREKIRQLMIAVRQEVNKNPALSSKNTTLAIGVSFDNWDLICEKDKLSRPKGMQLHYPEEKNPNVSEVFSDSNGSFKNSDGDIWLHVKSDDADACTVLQTYIEHLLASDIKEIFSQVTASQSKTGRNGKVLGCRFSENLNNPSDPISLAKHTLIGAEDIDHFGGSYVLSQRFLINWDQINMMSEDQIEDLIGRKTDDTIIPDRDSRSHIKASRVQDENGNTTPILRLGLPFGRAESNSSFRVPKSVTKADEAGIYFAGFAKTAAILEEVMASQIGAIEGFMNDRLFNSLHSDLGGIFYIPSLIDLALDDAPEYLYDFSRLDKDNWNFFPGMDWNRFDRHYTNSSDNGLMYYNHSNYLFNMATGLNPHSEFFKPPSNRILSLLENTFSLWQDNWYFNRKQEEIEQGVDYYIDEFDIGDKPENIMGLSIMLRKGWAIRLSLQLFSSENYGFRGRKILLKNGEMIPYSTGRESEGKVIYGSDTYRIMPDEIIVGAMPNLTLGEGRYVMKYLSEEERLQGFLRNLSEASGVGHVIPNYKKALDLGLAGLQQEITKHASNAQTPEKKDFYEASRLALVGISEYFLNYSKLAFKIADQMQEGQEFEIDNLIAIGHRMEKLSKDKPDTFIEAVQFIFTLHSCLHLNGEPTAFGRMDQLLQPFLDKDAIPPEEAQEIIDAFYIKLDEKVQQNRMFMEDHQPFGNLAMGGSSGPYPQGASLGQWIQQITVGGTVADGEEDFSKTKPAYNDVTKLFIRASGRLPLNAPCLSLRTRKDIPEDILEEAAHAILSGGAHPILLNDEKLIPSLHQSGDGVGGDAFSNLPIWNSKVDILSAQNYACDGCYEPQFPGENWFSLGGFSTLQPLECALNQGRTISSAGQSYLFGQTVSLNTKPADQIDSFEELLDLYKQHFELLNRKAFNGQILGYGANTDICPSPILNVLMDDCLAKGQDFYSGGAKYNIYGPCYISLSNTINSLYAIKAMVFDPLTAVTTLPELLECLCCDWGYKMTEPFISNLAGHARIAAQADRYKRLREIALAQPRYGRGNSEVDKLGDQIVQMIAEISVETFRKPWPQFAQSLKGLAERYGSEEHPFGIQIQPGVGTFENHVEMGAWNGASADGRRLGTTVASDLSPSPSPADLAVDHQIAEFSRALQGFDGTGTNLMADGAPTDFNIREDFGVKDLIKILKQFSQGGSSNILTITVANPETFTQAVTSPEQYNLLRVRTGGWSNFFTSVFPIIQEQHQRRPISTPDIPKEKTEQAKCPFHQWHN